MAMMLNSKSAPFSGIRPMLSSSPPTRRAGRWDIINSRTGLRTRRTPSSASRRGPCTPSTGVRSTAAAPSPCTPTMRASWSNPTLITGLTWLMTESSRKTPTARRVTSTTADGKCAAGAPPVASHAPAAAIASSARLPKWKWTTACVTAKAVPSLTVCALRVARKAPTTTAGRAAADNVA